MCTKCIRCGENAGKLLYNKGLRLLRRSRPSVFGLIKNVAGKADFNTKSQGV